MEVKEMANRTTPTAVADSGSDGDKGNKGTGRLNAAAFQSMLDETTNSGGQSHFLFPKAGKTRLRLLHLEDRDPGKLYTQVERLWQGKPKTKFMIRAIYYGVPATQGEPAPDPREVALVIPRQVLNQILQVASDGETELFYDGAVAVTIVRSGEGLNTSYQVIAGSKVAPPVHGLEHLPSLDVLATEFKTWQDNRAAQAAAGGNKGGGGTTDPEAEMDSW
jgi:hypothetical protein